MWKGFLAAVAVLAVLWAASGTSGQSALPGGAVGGVASGGPGTLVTHHVPGGPTGDYLIVIDPAARAMAVYRVQKERGEIALASVRRIDSDLALLSYNTERPLPEEIAAGLKRQVN
jgi:hypothetical protein